MAAVRLNSSAASTPPNDGAGGGLGSARGAAAGEGGEAVASRLGGA
jgi:hypothetical protein